MKEIDIWRQTNIKDQSLYIFSYYSAKFEGTHKRWRDVPLTNILFSLWYLSHAVLPFSLLFIKSLFYLWTETSYGCKAWTELSSVQYLTQTLGFADWCRSETLEPSVQAVQCLTFSFGPSFECQRQCSYKSRMYWYDSFPVLN